MTAEIFQLLIFLNFLFFTFVKSTFNCLVLVEYQSIKNPNLTPQEILDGNVNEYIKIIDQQSKKCKISIVIFPEATLDNVQTEDDFDSYGTQINFKEKPCSLHKDKYPNYLQRLSCAAENYNTNILFNIIEKREEHYYTSDVVLNNKGFIEFSIVKEKRIGAESLNNKPIPFVIPTRTDFRIYNYVFNSLVIELPFIATSLVLGFMFSYEKAIALDSYKDYLVCSNWISELPFLTSLQVYQMWAQEFNITIFFSSVNNPEKGQGGTGVCDKYGSVFVDVVPTGGTRVYVYNHDLEKMENDSFLSKSIDDLAKEMNNFHLDVDLDLPRYESLMINPVQLNNYLEYNLCYRKTNASNYFCCEFKFNISYNISMKAKKEYIYHMVAYKGFKTYHDVFKPGGIEVCAIIACLNSSLSSCGQRFQKYEEIGWPLTFNKITIKANFSTPRKEKIYYSSQFPNSLLSSIRPIPPNLTEWSGKIVVDERNHSYFQRTFSLIQPQNRILTFGIFGRNFTLHDTRSKAKKCLFYSSLKICLLLCFIFN